jgi:hypothetical protein
MGKELMSWLKNRHETKEALKATETALRLTAYKENSRFL